jgi:hypothetical protein
MNDRCGAIAFVILLEIEWRSGYSPENIDDAPEIHKSHRHV